MSQATRERLIETAFNLFAEHGFHSIGLDRIVRDVGVTKTTFYNHFPSKDDLAVEVLRRRDEWEQQSFAEALAATGGPTAAGQLHALFDVLETWFEDQKFRRCIFISAVAEYPWEAHPVHQIAVAHKDGVERGLRQLAEQAGAHSPGRLAAELTLLIEGATVYRHYEDNTTGIEIARRLAQRVLEEQLSATSSV